MRRWLGRVIELEAEASGNRREKRERERRGKNREEIEREGDLLDEKILLSVKTETQLARGGGGEREIDPFEVLCI